MASVGVGMLGDSRVMQGWRGAISHGHAGAAGLCGVGRQLWRAISGGCRRKADVKNNIGETDRAGVEGAVESDMGQQTFSVSRLDLVELPWRLPISCSHDWSESARTTQKSKLPCAGGGQELN